MVATQRLEAGGISIRLEVGTGFALHSSRTAWVPEGPELAPSLVEADHGLILLPVVANLLAYIL